MQQFLAMVAAVGISITDQHMLPASSTLEEATALVAWTAPADVSQVQHLVSKLVCEHAALHAVFIPALDEQGCESL